MRYLLQLANQPVLGPTTLIQAAPTPLIAPLIRRRTGVQLAAQLARRIPGLTLAQAVASHVPQALSLGQMEAGVLATTQIT